MISCGNRGCWIWIWCWWCWFLFRWYLNVCVCIYVVFIWSFGPWWLIRWSHEQCFIQFFRILWWLPFVGNWNEWNPNFSMFIFTWLHYDGIRHQFFILMFCLVMMLTLLMVIFALVCFILMIFIILNFNRSELDYVNHFVNFSFALGIWTMKIDDHILWWLRIDWPKNKLAKN